MKKILLTILSSFIFHIYSADERTYMTTIAIEGYDHLVFPLTIKLSDKVQDIIEIYRRIKKIAKDVEIKGKIKRIFHDDLDINTDYTAKEAKLFGGPGSEIWIENYLINITCRTLTGITFTFPCRIFDGLCEMENGSRIKLINSILEYLTEQIKTPIEEDRLKEMYKKLFLAVRFGNIKLIHRAKELPLDSRPYQIEGLLADPNITIIIQPRRR